jgi:hypothetical protein
MSLKDSLQGLPECRGFDFTAIHEVPRIHFGFDFARPFFGVSAGFKGFGLAFVAFATYYCLKLVVAAGGNAGHRLLLNLSIAMPLQRICTVVQQKCINNGLKSKNPA